MKRINLTFILLVCSSAASAQDYIDLFKFDYANTPVNKFDTTEVTTRLQEINGDLTVPIAINDNFALLTGLTFENASASFNPDREVESMTGITLKLGANIKFNSKWSGTYLLLPKISSDLKKISNRDFQFGGAVLMKYSKSSNFSYKFGVYANNELFGVFIVPIFGFYYLSPSQKFEAKVILPLAVDLNYSITKSVRFGLNFRGQVRTYNVNTPVELETNRYLTKSANDVYAYCQCGMKNGLNFQLGFGRSFARSYRMYNEKVSLGIPLYYFGNNRTQLNMDFSDGWLFKATVFYRLKLGKTTANRFKNREMPNTDSLVE